MSVPSGLFNAFRVNGGPTYYSPNQTPWMADILEAGLIFAFIILAASFFVILPGVRGRERLFVFIRVTVTLFIGAVILLANFTYDWDVAEQKNVRIKYKAGSPKDIEAEIGVHIGLRGINITLKGEPERQLNETINYNEHFDWRWAQGRLGFGIFAGEFNREFRAAQFRGLPFPILWIAEYFTFDGEGIRWGRFFRQAGWYSHIMMWLALPLWFLTVVLFFVFLKYGALFLMLTGSVMVTASIIWATLRNVNELVIPLSPGKVLNFHFGGSFYINLITGVLCIILGIIIFVMNLRYPREISTFFGVDVLQDADDLELIPEDTENEPEVQAEGDNMEMQKREPSSSNGSAQRAASANAGDDEDDDDDEIYEPPTFFTQTPAQKRDDVIKRKSRGFSIKKFQAPRRRPAPPVPSTAEEDEDDEELYENTKHLRKDMNPSSLDQVRINMAQR